MEQKFYDEIKNILITARNKVYQTANLIINVLFVAMEKSIVRRLWIKCIPIKIL